MKVKIEKPVYELKPLEVKCSHTKCEEGFHYYTSTVAPKGGKVGDCKDCGDSSIEWERLYKNDPLDSEYIFNCLKKELLRNVCWVNDIEGSAINRAKKRGKEAILDRAKVIITKRIAKIPQGPFDFKCTPKKGSEIIHYAQHATATCCRKCLERWHNIPQDIILSSEQIAFCVSLIEHYIDDRVPNLNLTSIK